MGTVIFALVLILIFAYIWMTCGGSLLILMFIVSGILLVFFIDSVRSLTKEQDQSASQIFRMLDLEKDKKRCEQEIEQLKSKYEKEIEQINFKQKEELQKQFDEKLLNLEQKFKKSYDNELRNKQTEFDTRLDDFFKQAKSNLTIIPYMSGIISDYETYGFEVFAKTHDWGHNIARAQKAKTIREIRKEAKEISERNLIAKYKLDYLLLAFPVLNEVLQQNFNEFSMPKILNEIQTQALENTPDCDIEGNSVLVSEDATFETNNNKIHTHPFENVSQLNTVISLKSEISVLTDLLEKNRIAHDNNRKEIDELNKLIDELSSSNRLLRAQNNKISDEFNSYIVQAKSNLSAIPYMSGIIADFETYGLEILARKLDWGFSVEREKKVKSIRDIRKDAQAMIERNKEAQYQLAYLLALFPSLQDVIECEFSELPPINVEELSEYDRTRDYLSKEEYAKLSTVERNQLALDRYKESKSKTKWQIGRDYELYIGYKYTSKGYDVDYFGSYMGLEDLGRDLIAKKGDKILIIQCKYWSSLKTIHEKHINQLYGTMVSYCIENNISRDNVKGLLITNITLSDMAKKMAGFLGIEYVENFKAGDYPCIKCNIGHSEDGETKIYHLPFDQQYDHTKIDKPGEFYAMTVAEAENAGFRRAFKYFGA